MSQRLAFALSTVLGALALAAAAMTAPVEADAARSWKTEHVAATAGRSDYWMAYIALSGRRPGEQRDTLARAEVICQTDSGARILVGPIPEKPVADTANGQAPYFTTVRARVISNRPFLRLMKPASKLEGDWVFRQLRNGGWLVVRTGLPVRRLAAGMRDDRRLTLDFANGRRMVFPLFGADSATASVLSRCLDV